MTHWEHVICPHCGLESMVEHLHKFKLLDVHPVRKNFAQLEARQFERDYFCGRCQQMFYGTLLRTTMEGLNDSSFYQAEVPLSKRTRAVEKAPGVSPKLREIV